MKQHICLIVFFMGLLPFIYGQNVMKREYEYDDAGNRTARKVLPLSNKSPMQQKSNDSLSETEDLDEMENLNETEGLDKLENFYVDKVGDISLKIVPNPTTSVVTLQIDDATGEIDGEITLYSLSGAKILSQRLSSYRTEIDLSSHPTGSYLTTVVINGKTSYWKIVKQ